MGALIDKIKHTNTHYFALQLYQRQKIHKDVADTQNATFSFDFLMACIGVVIVLLIALF